MKLNIPAAEKPLSTRCGRWPSHSRPTGPQLPLTEDLRQTERALEKQTRAQTADDAANNKQTGRKARDESVLFIAGSAKHAKPQRRSRNARTSTAKTHLHRRKSHRVHKAKRNQSQRLPQQEKDGSQQHSPIKSKTVRQIEAAKAKLRQRSKRSKNEQPSKATVLTSVHDAIGHAVGTSSAISQARHARLRGRPRVGRWRHQTANHRSSNSSRSRQPAKQLYHRGTMVFRGTVNAGAVRPSRRMHDRPNHHKLSIRGFIASSPKKTTISSA